MAGMGKPEDKRDASGVQGARGMRGIAWRTWTARVLVAVVFACNVQCAVSFIADPGSYIAAYQLEGPGAEPVARSIGITFLMWNCTYPLVIYRPERYRSLFAVVLAQQAVGLVMETWLLTTLGPGQQVLAGSIVRFVSFDGPGLAVMAFGFFLTRRSKTGVAAE